MDDCSPARLAALADEFGLDLSEERAADLAGAVEAFVDTTTPVPDAGPQTATASGATDLAESRSHWDPDDDPCDAIEYRCDVTAPDPATDALAGLDVGVKDAIAMAGLPLECGSAVAAGLVAPCDATVVTRVLDAGGRITAKLALDEFAGAPYGTTGSGPPVRNPRDPTRTAGGSSGGSAAAVAAGQVDVALGTDTGGSVRIPAGFCGVVGLKPTYGLVPLTGVVENTYTLDHVGAFGRTVRDVAATLDAAAGRDPADPASVAAAGDEDYAVGGYADAVESPPDPGSLRVAVLEEGFGDGVTDAVAGRVTDALGRLEAAGATVTTASAPSFESGAAVKNTLSACELADHWRARGATYRRGSAVDPDLQRALADCMERNSAKLDDVYAAKLLAGAWLIEATGGEQYTRAQAARARLRAEFDAALADADALALPTMPAVAPPLDAATEADFDFARNTRCANLTTHPAVTLPAGEVVPEDGGEEALPVGLQLVGERFGEAGLLGTARTVRGVLAGEGRPPGHGIS